MLFFITIIPLAIFILVKWQRLDFALLLIIGYLFLNFLTGVVFTRKDRMNTDYRNYRDGKGIYYEVRRR